MSETKKCAAKTEIYSRIVGYYRPIQNWNRGKKHEFSQRKTYKLNNIKQTAAVEEKEEKSLFAV